MFAKEESEWSIVAYNTSERYKELIYEEDSEQSLVIKINGTEINADYIKEFTLVDDVFNDSQFGLGSAIKSEITVTLDNDLVNELEAFEEMEIAFKLKISETGEEIIPLGNYIVKTIDNNSDLFTKYTMYDYMDKFEKTFDASIYVPCTRFELLQHICNECGVELANTSIINGDVEVNVYDNTITSKQYLAYISERAGGFAKVIRNKLYIRSFGEVDTNVLPIDKVGEYVIDDQKVVTKVIYENGTQIFECGIDDGYKVYLFQDNPFSCTQKEVDNIYNSIVGIVFQSLEVQVWGDPSIDTGDIIQIGGIKSFAQKNWKFSNGFYGDYKTPLEKIPTEANTTLVPTRTLIKRVQSKVDEQEGKITILSSEFEEVEGLVNEQTAQFELMNDQINTAVKSVEALEKSIDLFSVDLEQYTLTIPVDNVNRPYDTKNYDIKFYGYYKGKQVTPSASISGSNEGITTSTTDTYLRFAVSNTKAITNTSNEYTITFTYTGDGTKYTLTKKVNIALALRGSDGADGKDGVGTPGKDGENGKSSYQIWLDAGNTGTEQDYLDSLKGEDGQDGYTPVKGKDYFDGSDGKDGYTPVKGKDYFDGADGTSSYFYVRYSANSNGSSMTITPTSTTKYMGVASTTSSTAPTSYSAYTWSLIKGADGVGTPGKDGENGLTSYLHIKYSDDGVSFTPATDEYALGEKPSAWIGQYVDYSEADSNEFDDYEWYKFTENIDGTLEQMQDDINSANESINNTNLEVVQLKTDVTQDRESFKVNIEQLTQTVDTNNATMQENINNINNTLANGVETLKNTLVTIDIKGISVSTNVSKISTLITNNTFAITSSGTNLAYFGYDEENGTSIAEMDNLTIHNYFTAGYHRTEKFEIDGETRTGVFFVGGEM